MARLGQTPISKLFLKASGEVTRLDPRFYDVRSNLLFVVILAGQSTVDILVYKARATIWTQEIEQDSRNTLAVPSPAGLSHFEDQSNISSSTQVITVTFVPGCGWRSQAQA